AADIFVTFEGHYSDYSNGAYSQPAWVSNYSPSRFWHLVYDAPDVPSMQNAVSLATQRDAGWVYVTPNGVNGGNPWGALPTDPYWTDELDAVQGLQPPTPVGLVNGNFAAGLTGWTPFCRTWGQVPLSPTSNCGAFATTSSAGLQLNAAVTQYNQPYIGVTQTVATSAKAVLSGTVTVDAMATCGTDGGVFATAHLLNAAGTELGSIVLYRHPYTSTATSPDGCTPYLYASGNTVYYQDMPTWLPGAGPQNFSMDVAALVAQHLPGVAADKVAAITVELMDYADFTRPTITFANLGLSGNPVPAVNAISPATAAAASAAPLTLHVSGSNFLSGAAVQWQWNGQTSSLPTSVQSGTQLTATIPASLLSAPGVAYISVVAGGAASNQAPFYVTNSGATISGSNSASGSGSVTTSTGGVAATAADGSGTVTVAQYAADPAPSSTTFNGNGAYFDVHVATGSTFTSLTIQDCATNGGAQAYWYSPTSGWTLASNQRYNAATGCIAITANSSGSSPTIAQLTGTYFTFQAPALQSQTITFGPLPGKTYGDAPFAVGATASSGLGVSFAAGGACTVSGNSVSLSGAGTCTITASQAGNGAYSAASAVAQSFAIAKATPLITWANPAGIVYGAALGAAQLAAGANTAGTFSYTPAAGTVLHAGDDQTLAVAFAPTDIADYNAAAANVTINVLKATP
ncbi:MAG TPA: hypothetical protein VGP33_14210, partial [Chloroflexota bacterium]|nr:hypothetical protein [Chloroflexota bacterium]